MVSFSRKVDKSAIQGLSKSLMLTYELIRVTQNQKKMTMTPLGSITADRNDTSTDKGHFQSKYLTH